MSEIINNREQQTTTKNKRQEILKQIFKDLHDGKNVKKEKGSFRCVYRKNYHRSNFTVTA